MSRLASVPPRERLRVIISEGAGVLAFAVAFPFVGWWAVVAAFAVSTLVFAIWRP